MAIARQPRRYFRAMFLALRSGEPGMKGLLYQFFYFLEAGVFVFELNSVGVRHIHNHFGNSSCSVAMLASEMSGVPYSYTLHGPAELFEPMRWRMDLKISRAAFVACISHFARSQAMLFSDPLHWPKLRIVHCGVDPARYRGPSAPSDAGLRLLFVGRLAAVKGLRVLFEALTRARGAGVSLTVIGDGPERAHAEAEAERIGDISLIGYQSQDAVAKAFADADALVLPSFAEGVPVVLMEAMAAGLPVIATRVGGVGELVQDGVSGLLVAPGDVDALHDAIMALARDSTRRKAMGEVGAATVRAAFDSHTEAARLLALFSGEGGSAPRPEPYSR
jgi:glycosyltransferase involved in cell wall biosynthesis